jgi:hypothetical protein
MLLKKATPVLSLSFANAGSKMFPSKTTLHVQKTAFACTSPLSLEIPIPKDHLSRTP